MLTAMKTTSELVKYVAQFERHAKECFKKGTIEIFMMYGLDCETCQMEFNHFKNYLGIRFDGEMNVKEQENFEMIANRLLPIDTDSRLGKKLVEESRTWAAKLGNPDLEIKYKPSFLDAETHEKRGYGFIPYKPLRDMLNLNKLSRRRNDFKETYSKKLNMECNEVACGMRDRIKTGKNDKENRKK